jgi:hypothetical protein
MSKNTNCFKVHPDVEPGPCVYCSKHDISKRYIHLQQRVSDTPEFYKFVSDNFNISENAYVCRKCDLKFIRLFSRSQECPDESCMSVPKKTCKDDPCFLSYFNACDHQADHKTTINTTLFDKAFDISVINKFPTSNENYKTALCHVHYDKFNHYINVICSIFYYFYFFWCLTPLSTIFQLYHGDQF